MECLHRNPGPHRVSTAGALPKFKGELGVRRCVLIAAIQMPLQSQQCSHSADVGIVPGEDHQLIAGLALGTFHGFAGDALCQRACDVLQHAGGLGLRKDRRLMYQVKVHRVECEQPGQLSLIHMAPADVSHWHPVGVLQQKVFRERRAQRNWPLEGDELVTGPASHGGLAFQLHLGSMGRCAVGIRLAAQKDALQLRQQIVGVVHGHLSNALAQLRIGSISYGRRDAVGNGMKDGIILALCEGVHLDLAVRVETLRQRMAARQRTLIGVGPDVGA